MSSDQVEKLNEYIQGNLSKSEFEVYLAPGCELEHKIEKETRLVPDKPVQHWKRECTRVTNCDDSSNNSGWVCRPWERVS